MKILAIGANGVIGKAVTTQLKSQHEVITVGYSKGDIRVDISDKNSIEALFQQVGEVDAIISMAGNGVMAPLQDMTDEGFNTVLNSKVMGQVNLVRIGLKYLKKGGSITLTSGQAANQPSPGTSAIAMGTAAINAFVRTAALELSQNQRVNAVSPSFVKETMELFGMDSTQGICANDVASYYQACIDGQGSGEVFDAVGGQYVG